MYYARLDSNDPRYKPITTNLEKAAVSLGIKCSSRIIGIMKDHYDPYFENGRIGYTGEKNQRTKLMIAIQNYFESYSTDRLQIIVTAILKNEVLPFLDSYNISDFLKDVFITDTEYDELRSLVLRKNNIILQGPPGVGKTYAAKRLAWSIMGEKDDSRIAFIQFHQSYSYEDFIMGYRPNGSGGFELQNGIFYQFCEMTRSNPGKQYFFIIDEINRGNLSKIFGELLMLIEKDYRKESAVLSYSKESFSVPENLYLIGMMNTADRSLALIDYALRRRFSFFEMQPGFDSDGFKTYSKGLNSNLFEALIEKIKRLNNKIKDDDALSEGFMIGHSYFCNLTADTCTADRLRSIVEYDIVPILKEYWFDDKDTATKQADDLRGVFK